MKLKIYFLTIFMPALKIHMADLWDRKSRPKINSPFSIFQAVFPWTVNLSAMKTF